ncbi:hypothetical protein ACFX2C_036663 [Malus domestica]
MRQQGSVPSSVISSHSMHLGVLATAWHAILTGTMFTVYYKSRTSPAEFIVPFDQYMESVENNYSIGMRFKMRLKVKKLHSYYPFSWMQSIHGSNFFSLGPRCFELLMEFH